MCYYKMGCILLTGDPPHCSSSVLLTTATSNYTSISILKCRCWHLAQSINVPQYSLRVEFCFVFPIIK